MRSRIRRVFVAVACAVLVGAAPGFAQSADMRQAVAYVEVAPASTAAAAAAFKRYREAIAREPGFVSFDLFEQIGRRGHFAVIEMWRDQAAYDAHQSAAALAALKDALQPNRTSGYDLRPYKPLAVGPSRAPGRNAVAVVSHVDIGGGAQIDVPAILRALADASRAEPGCLRFDVTQHTMRANHFTVVEVWEDEQALDRHAAAAHTKKYRDDVQPVTGSPLDERVHKRVE